MPRSRDCHGELHDDCDGFWARGESHGVCVCTCHLDEDVDDDATELERIRARGLSPQDYPPEVRARSADVDANPGGAGP